MPAILTLGPMLTMAVVSIINFITVLSKVLLKETTLKITIPSDGQDISLIKFGSSKSEFESLYSDLGYVTIDVIGHFQKNVWNGKVSPQILIEDYEIVGRAVYYF